MKKTAVLLINLGSPKTPTPKDVFLYLNEFLCDPRVINLPFLSRHLLVKGLIAPFRCFSSAKSYQHIWTKEGAPLLVHTQRLKHKLQAALGEKYLVETGMRYQTPSLRHTLEKLKTEPLQELFIIPLFPQYASATTGSILAQIFSILKSWTNIPKLSLINHFYDHPRFIEALSSIAQTYPLHEYDHLLMSFHGLPEKQLKQQDCHQHCLQGSDCCSFISQKNHLCYGAQCYATAQALSSALKLKPGQYSVSFQSRLGKDPWLSPFTSDTIITLAKRGYKKLLVICPAFVCDCLETLYEIKIEYQELFAHHGGSQLTLMHGLNDHPLWIQTLLDLIHERNPTYIR